MEDFIIQNPEYKLLGKTKFIKLALEEGINKAEATEYFEKRELSQIYKKRKAKDKLVITAPPYSFQIDIFELTKYKATNNGIYRCLLCVDIISRKAFAYPLKSGKMLDILDQYEDFIKDVGEQIQSVAGDDFFNNQIFQTYNEELEIQVITGVAKDDHLTPQGNKLGIVDRLTRTLKNYIEKYMLEHETTKWTKFLPKIINLYNNSPHRAHHSHSTPEEVYDDEDYGQKLFEGQMKKNKKLVMEFAPNDQVRLLLGKGKFDKESALYSTEIYQVLEQIGFKFKVEGKKRLYRPSEMLMVKDVSDRINQSKKKETEAKQKTSRKVGKAMKEIEIPAPPPKETKKRKTKEKRIVEVIDGETHVEIEKFVKSEFRKDSGLHYLVKWKNESDKNNLWIPAKQLAQDLSSDAFRRLRNALKESKN